MKVTSPVGDFPFEPRALVYRDRSLVLEGAMGAWPATVTIEPGDIPGLVRLLPAPAMAAAIGIAVVCLRGIAFGIASPRRRR